MDKESKKENLSKDVQISEKNGVSVSYDKTKLKDQLPHLIAEINDRKKAIKIDSIEPEIEISSEMQTESKNECDPEELTNPKAIDFIRRCKTNEEAIEILDYLFKRKELSQQNYDAYKNCISQNGGLANLINQYGGHKKPGYYERKYFKKSL